MKDNKMFEFKCSYFAEKYAIVDADLLSPHIYSIIFEILYYKSLDKPSIYYYNSYKKE